MEITKEEILAYTDAATKTATALEKIADRLMDISSSQKNCQDKFCGTLVEIVKTNHQLLVNIDQKTEDIKILKWLWLTLGGLVGLSWIGFKIIAFIHGTGGV